MNSTVIGVDIGGTYLRIGAVDSKGNLSAFRKESISSITRGGNVPEALCDYIRAYISDNHLGHVAAVALGFPATMDKQRTRVLNAPNMNGLDNAPIREMLNQSLNIPVFLEKDVAMLFYHDMAAHNIPPDGIVIGCYVGTGIGNVIFMDGKLLTGASGVACELGHIPIPGNRRVCGCGNLGCMETVASGGALVRLITDRPIADAFRQMDEDLEQFIDNIAAAIAAEINILDPDMVILGGGVITMKDFPKKLLEQRIYDHTRKPLPAERLKFCYSEDSGTNGVLGAAMFARQSLQREA